jgi:hypothetical protein
MSDKSEFNTVVEETPSIGEAENCKFAISIVDCPTSDTDLALQNIRKPLKKLYERPFNPVADCDQAVRFASYQIDELKVRHTTFTV